MQMNAKILNSILKSLVLYRNTIELPAETIVLEQTIGLPCSIDLIGSQKEVVFLNMAKPRYQE